MVKGYFLSRPALIVSVLLALACESDHDKLSRLENDKTLACLHEQAFERDISHASPVSDTLVRQWQEAKTECDLATRDLNRFMH